jgi:hypothetical protein
VKNETHDEIVFRPPPGTRFTIWGSDCVLEFERGREREIEKYLHDWIDAYIRPMADASEAKQTLSLKLFQDQLMENEQKRLKDMQDEVSKNAAQIAATATK